jgi:DNA-binding response OmpR family regulator
LEQNILVVEDEEALRMVLGDRLRGAGYMVECAPDGESGFRKATSVPFDLMILDIMLPGRSGLDLCRDVRNAGLRTPILMLTACCETEVKVAGFKAGADDYVTKPFDMLELNARVEGLLRRTPASKSSTPTTTLPQRWQTQHSAMLESAPAAGQDSLIYPFASQNNKLREEFHKRGSAQKDSPPLVEVIPRLRKMLDKKQQTPQTPRKAAFLSVAEGVIEFLKEIFEEMQSPKRRR